MNLLSTLGATYLIGDPDSYNPRGLNEVTLPSEAYVGVERESYTFTLTRSRWEGCTFSVWASRVAHRPDGGWAVNLSAQDNLSVSDGLRREPVTAWEVWTDRRSPSPEPGAPYVVPALFYPDDWNVLYLPGEDVAVSESEASYVVTMRCSQWEGLHFIHPASLVRQLTDGRFRLRFGPDWDFTLRGGDKPLSVGRGKLFWDRCHPLPEPGVSLAYDGPAFLRMSFDDTYLRRGRSATSIRVVFPHASGEPGASAWFAAKLVKRGVDQASVLSLREDWTVKLTSARETRELTAAEFDTLTASWRDRAPMPTRGVLRHEPELLPPVEDVCVPPELLDVECGS